jgi:2'-5' RNA ligase
MRLAVVAYPTLNEADAAWLETVRLSHDPQASFIRAHFTLLFPCEADPDVVMGQAQRAVAGAPPIHFTAREFQAVRDRDNVGGHVFLVPAAGRLQFAAVHERLYSGVLREHLRAVLFVPHITVGAAGDFQNCAALAAELAASGRLIRGTVGTASVVRVDVRPIESLGSIGFAGSS